MRGEIEKIVNQLKKVKTKGSFVQNVSIVFSGNVVNFLLQIVFSPILSRVFGPEAYGEYAYYNLIISNIVFFGGLSLPMVYVIPKDRFSFLALGKVAFFSTSIVTLLSLCVYFIFYNDLLSIELIFGIVVLIVLNLLSPILSSENIRNKRFKKNVFVNSSSILVSKSTTLGFGLMAYATGGVLLIGDLITLSVNFFSQTSIKSKIFLLSFLRRNNWRDVFKVVKEYKDVIRYNFPSVVITKFSTDLPVVAIGYMVGTATLGQYVFALSLINIPIRLIENSFKPVVLQKANELYNTSKIEFESFFLKMFQKSIFSATIPVALIAATAPLIFSTIFGEEWYGAGLIAMAMSIKYMLVAVLAPYTSFWRIMKREKRLFSLNIISFVFRNGALLLCLFDVNFYLFIFIYAVLSAIAPLINLADLLFAITDRNKAIKNLRNVLVLFSVSTFLIVFIYVFHY